MGLLRCCDSCNNLAPEQMPAVQSKRATVQALHIAAPLTGTSGGAHTPHYVGLAAELLRMWETEQGLKVDVRP